MKFLFPLVLFVVAADDSKADLEKLQGSWKIVAVVRDGKKQPSEAGKEHKMTFKGDKVTLRDGDKEAQATCKLDAKDGLKYLDVVGQGDNVFTLRCIFLLEGDDLKIASAIDRGKEPPKDFVGGAGVTVVHLKREKS